MDTLRLMPMSQRRRRSREQLLAAIRDGGGVTRGDICAATGLSRSAVAGGVAALLAEGVVAEREPGPAGAAGRGRRAALLQVVERGGVVCGIDFGHAHVAAALAGTGGEIRAERRIAIDVDAQAQTALDTAAGLVADLLAESGLAISGVLAVAAGIPGPLDLATNRVRSPTILSGWVDVAPDAELARRIGAPVHVRNDADMGAQGELRFGAARGYGDFIYVKASHGVGAGHVLGGRPYRGAAGVAGEIGHTQVSADGARCRCGNRGCLEAVVSIDEIRRQLDAVGGGAAEARVLAEAGRALGRVLADLCNCLNPEAIVLGGELGATGEAFVAGVREAIDRRAQPAVAQAVSIRAAGLGLRSELLGAVATAVAATR
jgi:predicted NBD/HSP70 family sugar kinase